MTTHSYHPDSHEYGLADGCPRCDEHARNPEQGLDSRNIANLRERIDKGLEPRSNNEKLAMINLYWDSVHVQKKAGI